MEEILVNESEKVDDPKYRSLLLNDLHHPRRITGAFPARSPRQAVLRFLACTHPLMSCLQGGSCWQRETFAQV
jgi:hypothetical protein